MKELIKKILREEDNEPKYTGKNTVALDLKPIDAGPELGKQNAERTKKVLDQYKWDLLLQGLEIEEEEFEEPQVIKDLNSMIEAIKAGKNDRQLIRSKEFKNLNLDKDKLVFWREHLKKPEIESIWARTKDKVKRWIQNSEEDDTTVLREEEDLNSAEVHPQPHEQGGWDNPISDNSPGNVPPSSYIGTTYNVGDKKYYKPSIAKNIFFKATQILCKMKDASWFVQNEDIQGNLWERQEEMTTPLKVLGIEMDEGIADKIFWAANDNREGVVDGNITGYDQLYLRALVQYDVPLYESVREYKTVSWIPQVECYSMDDAMNTVMYDEDGAYDSYEWDSDKYNYSSESDEWDSDGKELDGTISVAKVLYQAEKGSEPVGDPNLGKVQESIIKEMGPGPEENDIMSELQELVDEWYACEEGWEVACSYKNQVQEIIDQYKSKGLYEHSDNFTSHSNEPQIGDNVVNTNPGCTHYKSEGVIEDINDLPDEIGSTITYRVTNDGESYTTGDVLTKTPDQLESL